jgi:hypothetical protein
VFESIQAMSLLTIMEIVGPLLLLAVLIYGGDVGKARHELRIHACVTSDPL